MHKMKQLVLLTGIATLVSCELATVPVAAAQNQWIDSIPQLHVGCMQGTDKPGNIDLGQLLKNAKGAGATATGTPFLTRLQHIDDIDSPVKWEACVSYTGTVQSSDSFQTRTLSPSSGAFQWCHGADAKTCGADLLNSLKKKISDFTTPLRVQPLCDSPEKTLTEIKASLPDVISAVSPISLGSPGNAFPPAKDELDKQLYGLSKEARPLLSVSGPPPA